MAGELARAEEAIWRRIGDEIVVIKDDGLSIVLLNKTAGHIWEMCDGEHDHDQIAASLCERFEVSYEEASADLADTVGNLERLGLLKRPEEVSGG